MATEVKPGQRWRVNECGEPAGCLTCGSAERNCRWFCKTCSPSGIAYTPEEDALITAWQSGARDFPRKPSPVAVASGGLTRCAPIAMARLNRGRQESRRRVD